MAGRPRRATMASSSRATRSLGNEGSTRVLGAVDPLQRTPPILRGNGDDVTGRSRKMITRAHYHVA